MTTRTLLALFAALTVAGTGASAARAAEFGLDRPPAVTLHEPLDIGFFESIGGDPNTGEGGVKDAAFGPPLVPDLRAGAHPDLSVDVSLTTVPDPPQETLVENLRDLTVDLPAGLYGDPSNRPKCLESDFLLANGAACTQDSQVGVAAVYVGANAGSSTLPAPVFLMESGRDDTALLRFSVASVSVTVAVTPRTESDGGLQATVRGVTAFVPVKQFRITLWGNPSDARHDRLRVGQNGSFFDPNTGQNTGTPSTAPPLPFLTAPARCDAPLEAGVDAASYQQPSRLVRYAATSQPVRTGCDQLIFAPSLRATPSFSAAGQPTGLGVDLDVPQTNSMDERATPQVKDVSVRLPEGAAISPGAADGLAACTDAQLDRFSRAPEQCPEASRVGATTITTPLFDEKLTGSVYLVSQLSGDPASGDMYRLFVVAYVKGVRIKLVGRVAADPSTGRLTATFAQNPQLPFSNLRLDLKNGPRALLANPRSCGSSSVSYDISSYAGTGVSSQLPYTVDRDCGIGRLAPLFDAGTLDPAAGRFSPFVTSITRGDDQQDLAGVRIDLPSGLLGAVGAVPRCGAAQAAAGTCGAASRIGSVRVAVGTGPAPFSLPGVVYLGGPYRGAPFSLSIVVEAKAGPLDLGRVVVRSPLVVDANNARVSAPVDPLPRIVGGVPLHYRSIGVRLDRPGFTFNATNCTEARAGLTSTSTANSFVPAAVRYQPQRCERLRFAPKLRLGYSGTVKRGANPKLTALLSQRRGEANLEQVRVTLPAISSLRPENADALCQPEQVARRACPRASMVGRAAARTPALPGRLSGPVYLVQGFRKTRAGRTIRTLPKLYVKLDGSGVSLDLSAQSSVTGGTRLATKFTAIPDAPVSDFRLEIDGGRKGILTAVKNPCTARRTAEAGFLGQNGKQRFESLRMSVRGCASRR